jgi:hypothetical protein
MNIPERFINLPEDLVNSPGYPHIHEAPSYTTLAEAYNTSSIYLEEREFKLIRERGYSEGLITELKSHHERMDELLHFYGKEKRASGDETITHSQWIENTLINLNLPEKMLRNLLIAANYHDGVEDLEITFDQIKEWVGEGWEDVVYYVNMATKVKVQADANGKVSPENRKKAQELTQRKILNALIDNKTEAIFLKLADVAHNGLTEGFLPLSDKKILKAHAALDVYAPLADKLGWSEIAWIIKDTYYPIVGKDAESYNQLIERFNTEEVYLAMENEASSWSNFAIANNIPNYSAAIIQAKNSYLTFQQISQDYQDNTALYLPEMSIYVPDQEVLDWYSYLYQQYRQPDNSKVINPVQFSNEKRSIPLFIPIKDGNKELYFQLNICKESDLIKPILLFNKDIHLTSEQVTYANSQIEKISLYFQQLQLSETNSRRELSKETLKPETFIILYTPKGKKVLVPQGVTYAEAAYFIGPNLGNQSTAVEILNKDGEIIGQTSLTDTAESDLQIHFITDLNAFFTTARFDNFQTETALEGIQNGIADFLNKMTKDPDIAKQYLDGKIIPNLKQRILETQNDSEITVEESSRFIIEAEERGIKVIEELYKLIRGKSLDINIPHGFSQELLEKFGQDEKELLFQLGLIPLPVGNKNFKSAWQENTDDEESTLQSAQELVMRLIEFRESRAVMKITIGDRKRFLQTIGELIGEKELSVQIRDRAINTPQNLRLQEVELIFIEGDRNKILEIEEELKHLYQTDITINSTIPSEFQNS